METEALAALELEKAEDRVETLRILEVFGEERKIAIDEAQEMRREAERVYQESLTAAKTHHRNANRVLIEAVAAAQEAGVKKADICASLSLTNQLLSQLKRTIQIWDQEERETQIAQDNREAASAKLDLALAGIAAKKAA